MAVKYDARGDRMRKAAGDRAKKRIRRPVTPEVFERTVWPHVQALKFVPEYIKARRGLFKSFDLRAIRAAVQDIASRPRASHEAIHEALRHFFSRFGLPIVVPPDPGEPKDLPPLPRGPLPWSYGFGPMQLGVTVVKFPVGSGEAATVARLDIDMERTLRELKDGLGMVRRRVGIKGLASPEQFGVRPLAPQPGLSSTHEPRIDVDLRRPDPQIVAGLKILKQQAQAAQKAEAMLEAGRGRKRRFSQRTLRKRRWDDDNGYARAFELLKFSRARDCTDPERLTRMFDPNAWEDVENLDVRDQLVERTKHLLKMAEWAVMKAAAGVGLFDWIESTGAVGKPTEELEAEVLAELEDAASNEGSAPPKTERRKSHRRRNPPRS